MDNGYEHSTHNIFDFGRIALIQVIINNDHLCVFENTLAPGVVYPMSHYPKHTNE